MSVPTTMKAITYASTGGVEVLDFTPDFAVPQPQPTEFVIKVAYAGVNMIDTYFRAGLYPTPKFPAIIGNEISGTIVKLPTDEAVLNHPEFKKRNYSVGQKVATWKNGSHAEYITAPWVSTIPVPQSIALSTAAGSVVQGLTALTFMTEAYNVKQGDTVLVHTVAGGLGLCLAQVAKSRGATVIGTTSSEQKAEVAKKAGADHVIIYKNEDTVKRVLELTNGKGVEAIFDGVGKDTFEADFEMIKRKGTIVSIGNASGPVPPFAPLKLVQKNVKLARPAVFNYLVEPEEVTFYGTQLFELIEKGTLKINIHQTYPFTAEGVRAAQTELVGGKTIGKLVVQVAGELPVAIAEGETCPVRNAIHKVQQRMGCDA